jgi:leader peptidase (prepilin peptidase)/N-methyltransferase
VGTTTSPAHQKMPARPVAIPRHPLLAAAVSALTVMSFGVFGFTVEGAIAALACVVLAVLSAIDIAERVLPNRIVFPAFAVILLARLADTPDRTLEWALAGLAAAVFLALPLLVRRDAMGLGDIKLALLLGAIVGWDVFAAIVIGCFVMVPVALVMLARDGSIKGATLPFGPFLAAGTLVALFLS